MYFKAISVYKVSIFKPHNKLKIFKLTTDKKTTWTGLLTIYCLKHIHFLQWCDLLVFTCMHFLFALSINTNILNKLSCIRFVKLQVYLRILNLIDGITSNKSSTSVVTSCTLANNIADTRNYKNLPDLAVFDSSIDLSCPILFCFLFAW